MGDVVTLRQESGGYLWNVDDSITQYLKDKVLISAYLRITVGDTVRWSSCPFWFRGCGLPDVDAIVEPPTVSAIDQMLQAIQAHQAEMAEQEQRVGDMVADGGRQLSAVTGLANQVAEDAQGVEADKNATHEYMVRAEDAAEGARDSAQAAESALDKLTNLNVTAKTLPPGSDATVTKTTTPDGYALAFGIPRGDKGEDGSDAEVTAENIQSALGYAPVKDVQVAGSSVLVDGVANVPIASETKDGVIKAPLADGTSGIQFDNDNRPCVFAASEADITTRQTLYRPLVPAHMDYAVKSAMCDGKGAAWTADEQKAARERMGIAGVAEMNHITTIVTEEETDVLIVDLGKQCKICRFYYTFPEVIPTGYTYVEVSNTKTERYNMCGCNISSTKYLDYIRIASALKPISMFAPSQMITNEATAKLEYSMPMNYQMDETNGFRYLIFTTYNMKFPKNTTVEIYAV